MSGKSNILDVLRFLREVCFPPASWQGLSYALAQRGGVNEVFWKGGEDKLISIALEGFDAKDPKTKYKYLLQVIAGQGDWVSTQEESLKVLVPEKEVDLILRQQGNITLLNTDGKNVGGIGQSGVSALQYASPGWDGYKFAQWVESWRFYHLLPPKMKEPSSMSLGEVLTKEGENFSAWLMWLQTKAPEAFVRLNEVLRDVYPDVLQIKSHPTGDGKVYLQIVENGLKRPATVWQMSDGFLALAALLSLIYAPPEQSSEVVCVEEPENHLHPRLLETVVALLRQVQQEALASNGVSPQILLTTHSPYLVNQLSLDEVIWIEKKDGASKAYRPADKQHLKELIENKDLGLGELMVMGALGEDK